MSATAPPTQERYYRNVRPEVAPFLPANYRTVLEVGCAEGLFARHLAPNAETWGIEPTPAAERAAQRLHRVLRGTFDEVAAELPDKYFDLVICNDVIEHMASPDAFLEAVKPKLSPNGRVIGSVPNVRFATNLVELFLLKDFRYEDSGIRDRTHLRFFTGKSLARMLREHGFVVEELRGINSTFGRVDGPKLLAIAIGTALMIAVTLGYWSDVRFLQFGFRARLPGSTAQGGGLAPAPSS